jgi:hypothetical protein
MSRSEGQSLKLYTGFVWIGDSLGTPIRFWAKDAKDAQDQLEAEYGTGRVYTLQNDEDAARPR